VHDPVGVQVQQTRHNLQRTRPALVKKWSEIATGTTVPYMLKFLNSSFTFNCFIKMFMSSTLIPEPDHGSDLESGSL
jgi:hypothetical protein